MFYHGTTHKIANFSNEFVGGKEANDQEGPGIYFTSSWNNARSYGPYVYTVKLKESQAISTELGSAPAKQIEWLIKNAPNWEDTVQNFDENVSVGLRKAVKSILEYEDTPHKQFQQVWVDFYRYRPVDYVKNMVKLGYDIVYIKNLESMIAGEKNITHAIVLNPAIIQVVEVEDDRTEEEKKFRK